MARSTSTLVRPLVKVLSATGAALVVATLLPTTSQAAQPTPKTVTQAQAQIDQLDNQAEIASEQANEAQAQLAAAQQSASAAIAAAGRAHQIVATEQLQVGTFAADAYESGGLSEGVALVLSANNPAQTLSRIATLQQLSGEQSATLSAVRTADLQYQQSLDAAAQATVAASQLSAQLSAKKAQISTAIEQSQQVLARLTAAQRAQLLAAQKAKLAAEQARAAVALASYQRTLAARTVSRSLARTADPAPAPADSPTPTVAEPAAPSASGSSVASRAVAAAMSRLGHAYVFGADGPNTFDCSGLVQWAYGQAGVSTTHYTGTLWNDYPHIPESQLEPGDLVFFYSDHHHVGIYIGGGMMINAPHTGDVVRIMSIAEHGSYSGAVRVGD